SHPIRETIATCLLVLRSRSMSAWPLVRSPEAAPPRRDNSTEETDRPKKRHIVRNKLRTSRVSSFNGASWRHLGGPQESGLAKKGSDDHGHGPGRREVLECMLWAGTGVLWTVTGGVPKSSLLGSAQAA